MTPDHLAALAVQWWETLPAYQRSPEALEPIVRHQASAYALDEAEIARALAEAKRLAGFGEEGSQR